MSDFLLPIDFEVNLPRSPVALGQWLLKNGVTEEIVDVLKENSVDGPTFRTLTDRDLKDLLPSFLQRKKIREWAQSVVSGQRSIAIGEEDVSLSNTTSKNLHTNDGESDNEADIISASMDSPCPDKTKTVNQKRASPTTTSLSPEGVSQGKRPRQREAENTRPSSLQSSSIAITDGTNCDIVSLAQTLKLVVPSSVRECRRKNEAISNRARHDVIKSSLVILQATIGRDAPSQSEFEVCAQRIVALLPELKDPIPPIRQDAFKPWSTTLMQLKKAYYNRKPVEKPRKNKEAASSQEMENVSTEEGHDSKLKKEMNRKKPDIKTICSLLKASFNHRRKWICKLQGKGTVKKILEEYPGFKNWELLMMETSLITETRQYKEAWLKMLPKLGDYVEEHAQDVLEEENVENFKEIGEDGQTLLVMLSLPKAWDIQEKFIHFVEDGDNFERFIKKGLNAECHLVAAESSDKVQLFIIIDNEVIVETDSYLNGLFCFFGAQHVFNLEFTQSLKLCFKFLEEYVFGIPQKKRSTQYRSGVAKLLS